MLQNVYAPSDYDIFDVAPATSVEDKLAVISQSPVRVMDDGLLCSFDLPFGFRADAIFSHDYEDGLITNFGTFDENLRQRGIGTRLLSSIFRYCAETRPNMTAIASGWARLGYLNTLIKICGEENVSVGNKGFDYGNGTDRPLSDIFVDQPPEVGKRYLVWQTSGLIDLSKIHEFELPVRS